MNSPLPAPVPFVFPAESPHAGMPLGNGTFGALVWGGGTTLRITINRQDYWQHAGEIVWQPQLDYHALVEYVQSRPTAYDSPEIIAIKTPGTPTPTRLPVGRFDLALRGAIQSAELDVATGVARVQTSAGLVELVLLPGSPLLVARGPIQGVTPLPNNSPEVSAYRARYHMPEPTGYFHGQLRGWIQEGLDGQVLAAGSRLTGTRGSTLAWVGCVLGRSVLDARESLSALLEGLEGVDHLFEDALAQSVQFARDWWQQSAWVQVEHRPTQILFDLGMFKLMGLTRPGGPAPTLQGPWVEDDRMPPWGSDYHFNINVQMCHWPMLAGNHLEMFEPGIRMLKGWFPKMREYARIFSGVEDGLMLPHAVDDRCIPADTFWRCQFDPGSIGWTALIYWDLYRYGGDENLLREFTYPLLRGALRLYESLLIERDGQYVLPFAPTPEFFPTLENIPGALDWGENASFQLAILHALLRAALRSVEILGIEEPRCDAWRDVQACLPKACVENERIVLFKGLDLPRSHRHHSHLAGIYPFETLDVDGADRELVRRSIRHWVQMGTGAWSGWCVPWAAILWARLGDGLAAGAMLDQYRRFFTGPNYASRHDAVNDGFTVFRGAPHVMQIDAAMGAVTAILEMLAHEQGGQVKLAPAVPVEWGDVTFGNLRLPGGRLVSGERKNGVWTFS